jgi:hypothetical protein
MNIGVVCEGATDYPAIEHFFRHALKERNVNATIVALFPEMDNTRPDGGWGNVLLWLNKNPPNTRIRRYFGNGLFRGGLGSDRLDAIIIHLDTDILPNDSFRSFVKKNYDYQVTHADTPQDKAFQIKKLINVAAKIDHMTIADQARHIAAPAVESTEAWCVAAFTSSSQNFEEITGDQLINSFMDALERSERGVSQGHYVSINKDKRRRKRFCIKHADGSARIVSGCHEFAETLEKLVSLDVSQAV